MVFDVVAHFPTCAWLCGRISVSGGVVSVANCHLRCLLAMNLHSLLVLYLVALILVLPVGDCVCLCTLPLSFCVLLVLSSLAA